MANLTLALAGEAPQEGTCQRLAMPTHGALAQPQEAPGDPAGSLGPFAAPSLSWGSPGPRLTPFSEAA